MLARLTATGRKPACQALTFSVEFHFQLSFEMFAEQQRPHLNGFVLVTTSCILQSLQVVLTKTLLLFHTLDAISTFFSKRGVVGR